MPNPTCLQCGAAVGVYRVSVSVTHGNGQRSRYLFCSLVCTWRWTGGVKGHAEE